MNKYRILILGASYGSLLGIKLALAEHDVDLVCLPQEVELINKEGAIVRLPIRDKDKVVELRSTDCPGNLRALGPGDVDISTYDLIALAMQEPQYGAEEIAKLLKEIGLSKKPCMSIMNMPLSLIHISEPTRPY